MILRSDPPEDMCRSVKTGKSRPVICCIALCVGWVWVCVMLLRSNDNVNRDVNYPHNFQNKLKLNHVTEKTISTNTSSLKHLFETLQSKGILKYSPGGYTARYEVLREFSESQTDSIVAAFGVPNLNSSAFKQQFLVCTGLTLAKKSTDVLTNEGNVIMPKHYQTCKHISEVS